MTEIKIEKGVPIPRAGRPPKYPWDELEVGDSFFVPLMKPDQIGGSRYSIPGRKYAVRTVIENGVKGVRVWRIA